MGVIPKGCLVGIPTFLFVDLESVILWTSGHFGFPTPSEHCVTLVEVATSRLGHSDPIDRRDIW